MEQKLTDQELTDLFQSIDLDGSGVITFPELAADFKNVVDHDVHTLIEQERQR